MFQQTKIWAHGRASCRNFKPHVAGGLSLFLTFVIHCAASHAQTMDWNNSGAGGAPDPYLQNTINWDGGVLPGSADTARFDIGRPYEVWWDSRTASSIDEVEFLQVVDGNVSFLNQDTRNQHSLTINGSSASGGAFSDFSVSGAGTSLTVAGLHLRSLGGALVSDGATMNLDGSHAQGTNLTVDGIGLKVEGILNIQSGANVDAVDSYIGFASSANATASITGSQWNNTSNIYVGHAGNANLDIGTGATVTSKNGYLGYLDKGDFIVNVSGTGAQWNNSDDFYVGREGKGMLDVQNRGVVSSQTGYIASRAGSIGVATVTGSDSAWNTDNLFIGGEATAAGGAGTLNINDSGQVTVGMTTKLWSTGTLNVDGGTITTNVLDNSDLGALQFDSGAIVITGAGGLLDPGGPDFQVDGNTATAQPHLVFTNGANATNLDGDLIVGAGNLGRLTISDAGEITTNNGMLGQQTGSGGVANVTGFGSRWNTTTDTVVGFRGTGVLSVQDEGTLSTGRNASIGASGPGIGLATVRGAGSNWNVTSKLTVGEFGDGTLSVEDKGMVTSQNSDIGSASSATGEANVVGAGSQWNVEELLRVGDGGKGTLNISSGGLVSSNSAEIGSGRDSIGSVVVSGIASGTASRWDNTDDISVGVKGTGNLRVENSGHVVSRTGFIGELSGSTTGPGTAGYFPGSTGVATITGRDSKWENTSDLFVGSRFSGQDGNGTLNISGGASVEVARNVVIAENKGAINLNDATIEAMNYLNDGVVTTTGNDGIIHGNFLNLATGLVATRSGAHTIFRNSLDHNGLEIETETGATTSILGEYTGASHFTGLGTARFDGNFRPGNSAAIIDFGGNVVLDANSNSFFELGGLLPGEFDQLLIDGDLSLSGILTVDLLSGFNLDLGDEFLIADVGGSLFGQFNGLGEGGLVGNYGGQRLYVSYDGGDVRLFTAIPEPGTFGLFACGTIALIFRRRRGRTAMSSVRRSN